jgi:hypothetical protein
LTIIGLDALVILEVKGITLYDLARGNFDVHQEELKMHIEEALTEEDWNNRSLEIFQTFVCLYLSLKLVLPSETKAERLDPRRTVFRLTLSSPLSYNLPSTIIVKQQKIDRQTV